MTRRAGRTLHVTLVLIGAVLYFLFILPRWWVLTGAMPSTLGTVGRLVAGLPIALAALPVVLALKQSIEPSSHSPELALRLRAWSALLHVVAGALILLTAVAEIWLSLTSAGPWLFAVYGAAGAIAILGVLAFYLSYVAEKPPAEPKPTAEKKPRRLPSLGRKKRTETDVEDAETDADADADTDAGETETEVDEIVETDTAAVDDETDDQIEVESETAGALRNKRPTGKSRNRLRTR